ncbi:MAG: CDP-alcohol phosphatidyltransferase family protein [Gammaproteobacteria bacterium]
MRTPSVPDCLSLSRVALAPLTAWTLVEGSAVVCVILFGAAVVSDLVDGPLARRQHATTRFGTLLDHGADALYVTTLSATGAWLGLLPPVLPLLITCAFAQYALDSRAFTGSGLGRWNGIGYFMLAGALIVVVRFPGAAAFAPLLRGLGWVLLLSTLASMLERAVLARRDPRVP